MSGPLLHERATPLFAAQDVDGIAALVREAVPGLACTLSFCRDERVTVVTWEARGGTYRFLFSSTVGPEHAAVVAHRWTSLTGLFALCQRTMRLEGRVGIEIGDEGAPGRLQFCGRSDFANLIPDSDFLSTGGYRIHRAGEPMPWADRHDRVLWRGSTTGQRTGDVLDLPRLRLCRMAREAPILDCAITGIVQMDEADRRRVEAQGLTGPHVPASDYASFRYHVDIDGNANAWSSLMTKLLSGGVVLKVASPHGYRQWYYDRLVPWHNVVPVRADLGDLLDAVEALRRDPERARAIAAQGRALALALDEQSALEGARAVVARLFAESALSF